jgi:hypothetical protein
LLTLKLFRFVSFGCVFQERRTTKSPFATVLELIM